MSEFLVRRFVKNHEQTELAEVRTAYGILAGVIGILCNCILFLIKLTIGSVLNSISVTADAFNNLSDAASSVIGFVGIKMASKPADASHPFGHGRIEYLSAFIVAFLVIQVGITFLKDSIKKIFQPEEIMFQLTAVIILFLSIGIKLWLAYFNKKYGEKIQSKVMKATATDALGDVLTTFVTIVSILVSTFFSIQIDGIVGVIVALIVMWAGYSIAKDTLTPLIGEPIDPELYEKITQFVEQYDGIIGTHDLLVHNYGPAKSMASIHAEVPNYVNIEASHEVIDAIERDVLKKFGIFLVIHMDPIETLDEKVKELRDKVENIASQYSNAIATIHDFRFVNGTKQKNLIFDLVVPYEYTTKQEEALIQQIKKKIEEMDACYQCVINVERSFVLKREK